MHLSYLYIKDFAVLKNVGFTFDNHFVFTMTEGVLQIKRKPEEAGYPEGPLRFLWEASRTELYCCLD